MKMVGCDNPDLVMRSFEAFDGSTERYLADGSLCILGKTPSVHMPWL